MIILDIDFMSYFFHIHSGTLVKNIGFEWMMFGIGLLCFVYAPLLLFLKAPPTKEEKKVGDDDGHTNTAIDLRDEHSIKNHETNGIANENLFTKL